ncbi:MAG: patatin-like phospholipase family protein [Nocardiaceae bacterium]|nr:patatin-like phospholipase family protein [Nocardiaceae bacterium]
MPIPAETRVAFVLGGGGILGATQVGMLRALLESGQTPDLVLGTSVGALNGAILAGGPSLAVVDHLTTLWTSMSASGVFAESVFERVRTLVKHGTHLHSPMPLRQLLEEQLAVERIEDLPIPFQCVAASIERAAAHWFTEGSIADAVLASCAVPGLLPPVRIGGETYIDGGIVDSVPVGRAVQLGATEVYVLHVGRIEQPLKAPRRPWEVGLVAFEIARRHRFVEEMSKLPDGVNVHLLPSGSDSTPSVSLRYRSPSGVADRIQRGYDATSAFLNGGATPQ